jgi:EAL domain-containing protein (putative c-di-GMP-specific phosphodiesterase class I)
MKLKKEVVQRSKAIHDKVNLLERLHKACQLTRLGIAEPILNETRYLSRALADMLHYQEDDKLEYMKALGIAELAVHSAINDAVDILLTYVKTSLANLKRDYPSFAIALSTYGGDYVDALKAMEHLDCSVIYSRENRRDRYQIYKKLADHPANHLLKTVSSFALKIKEIEATAQRTTDGYSGIDDESVASLLIRALENLSAKEPIENSPVLEVYFQPKYNTASGEAVCVGAEALLRLSFCGNKISPKQFIGVAERSKLIEPLGRLALKASLEALSNNPGLQCVSVNVSTHELLSPNYADEILALLNSAGVAPERLELEITEGTVIADLESASHLLKLSQCGVKVSIDDFGTGETKFDYLADIPIKVIKIDKSMVDKFLRTPESHGRLIKAVIAVGKSCGLDVIAEGIESEADAKKLQGLGLFDFQGFHFGRPCPIEVFLKENASKFPSIR